MRVSRERLIATLWPEASQERGRALLSESLYVLRTGVHQELFVTAGDEIGLNPDVISTDTAEFAEAISSNAHERAIELYLGPFLDGFFIADSAEFDRWSERLRDRFAAGFRSAMSALAEVSESRGDLAMAQRHWTRLADDDAYNGRYVYRLMRVLAAKGDRAGALRAAERHAEVLTNDLEVDVDPEVADLVAQLRTLTTRAPAAEAPAFPEVELPTLRPGMSGDLPSLTWHPAAPEPADAGGAASNSRMSDDQRASMGDSAPPAGATPIRTSAGTDTARLWRGTSWLRRAVFLGLAATFLGAAAVRAWHESPFGDAANADARPSMISVLLLPFPRNGGRTGPADRATEARTARELSTLLSVIPRLWLLEGRDDVDSTVSWRTFSVGAIADHARRQGARYVLAPEFLDERRHRLSVQLIDVGTRARIATASAAMNDSAETAIRSLALDIARIIAAQERLAIGEATHVLSSSASPEALGHFLVARRLMLAADVDGAVASLVRAEASDPSFLLAYARHSVVETWNPRWDFGSARDAVERGLQHAAGQPPIFRRLLEAQRDFVYRRCAESIDRFQRLAVDAPDLPDAWSGLGESIYHCRGFAGGSGSDAVSAFERAVTADAAMSAICEHLTELAIVQGDSVRARKYVSCVRDQKERDAFAIATDMRFGPEGRRGASRRLLDTLPRNTVSNLSRIFAQSPAIIDTLGQALMHATRNPADRMWGADYRLLALIAMKDAPAARAAWLASSGRPVFDKWVVAAYLAGHPVGDIASPMLTWARSYVREAGGPDLSTPYSSTRDPFRALVHNALRSGTEQQVAELERYIDLAAPSADASDPEIPGMRAALRARIDLIRADTASAILALTQSLQRAPWWVSPWAPLANAAPERRLLSVLHAARGNLSDAERWRASFRQSGALGDLLYLNSGSEPDTPRVRHAVRP